jgi:ribose transport system substrate-binding protein
MSERVRERPRRRLLLLPAALIALSPGLGACSTSSSGSASSSASSAVSTSPAAAASSASSAPSASGGGAGNLATFEAALQADYKGEFTAPPTSAPAHKAGVNLWIISCGQASEGCASPVASAKEAAQALGWKATVFDGNFGIGDAYNAGIRQAIAAHAQAIITIGVDCGQAKSGYQAAKAAGILLVGANSYDCTDPAVHDGSNLFSATTLFTAQYPSSAATAIQRGKAKADWIIVHTKGQAQVINTDFAGLTGGVYENQGFVQELAKCTTCKIVKTITYSPADTADGTLKQEWASALAQYPDANAGVIISDGIVIQDGLAQAIQSAGRTKTFSLVSGEGYAPNASLIRNQDGEAAVAPADSNWMAWGAVDTVLRLLDHDTAVDEGMGIQVLDATHNLPASGQNYSAPVNYKADYLKIWGVS